MQKIMIDGIEKTISGPTRERGGWTWFYVVDNGRNISELSVPTHWFNKPDCKVTTGGHVYQPAPNV